MTSVEQALQVDQWLMVRELAEITNVSVGTVYRILTDGLKDAKSILFL